MYACIFHLCKASTTSKRPGKLHKRSTYQYPWPQFVAIYIGFKHSLYGNRLSRCCLDVVQVLLSMATAQCNYATIDKIPTAATAAAAETFDSSILSIVHALDLIPSSASDVWQRYLCCAALMSLRCDHGLGFAANMKAPDKLATKSRLHL